MMNIRRVVAIAIAATTLTLCSTVFAADPQKQLDQLNDREKQLIEKLEAVQQREREIQVRLEEIRRRKQYLLNLQAVHLPGKHDATPAPTP